MADVRQITSEQLSTYRTKHRFRHFAEFTTLEEYRDLLEYGRAQGLKVYILGNGSNTLFTRRTVKTLVLKNRLERSMRVLDDLRVEVSSSTLITTVLKHCEKNGLDSFYYLASVPATIGGALAMNAGQGKHMDMTIFDFVESITYAEDGELHTVAGDEVEREYRRTKFAGLHDRLILSAVLRFEPVEDVQGKIRERIDWSKEVQDHSAPNCGSVFRRAHPGLLKALMGFRFGKSRFSPKVANWISTNASSPRSIVWPIRVAKIGTALLGRRARLEIIEVD